MKLNSTSGAPDKVAAEKGLLLNPLSDPLPQNQVYLMGQS